MDMIKNQKYSLNRKVFPFFLLFLVLATLLPLSSIASAATDKNITRIYDYAQTLSNAEKQDLEELAESYYQKTGNNYLIVTTTTRNEYEYTLSSSLERDCELYSEAFYNSFIETYGDTYKNCTILTVDLSSNRYADISGQSDLKQKLDDSRCTKAFDKIASFLTEADYTKAYSKYMNVVNRYQKFRPGINPDNIFFHIWFQLLVSIIIGGIIIIKMIYNSGGKMTASGQTYLDKEHSRVLRQHDHYIRTHTSRVKRESNSDSSSSSSGSSGGGSHGGGHF